MDGPTNSLGSRGIVDYSSRLLTTDNVRFEIVLGNAYRASHKFTDVAAGASVYLMFDPSANGAHPGNVYKCKMWIGTTARPITIEGYEGAVCSDNGTEIVIHNFNRNDGCDASLNNKTGLYHTPTVDSSGNKYVSDGYVYADASNLGSYNITAPGDTTDEYSAYLNPLYKYLWKFTNTGDAATTVMISLRILAETEYRDGGI